MKKIFLNFIILTIAASLAACSSNPLQTIMPSHNTEKHKTAADKEVAANESVSGNLSGAMDEIDKSKMLHALDKSPGTPTHWVNANTGISYTVVPVKKVIVGGNQFCRTYTTTASKDGKEKQTSGTACVGEDGNWKSI